MQDRQRHFTILEALASGIDPISGEVFETGSPYNHPEVIRALFFALNGLKAVVEKGNQGLAWTEEGALLAERFADGIKVTELARLHSRTYGAIKARRLKLKLLQK